MLYKRIYFTHQNIAIFNQIIANSLQSKIKITKSFIFINTLIKTWHQNFSMYIYSQKIEPV